MPRKMLTLLLSAALLLSLTGTAFSAAAQEAAGRGETAPAGDNAEVTGEEIAAAPTYTAFLKDHNITDENAAPAAGQAIRLDSGHAGGGNRQVYGRDGQRPAGRGGQPDGSLPGTARGCIIWSLNTTRWRAAPGMWSWASAWAGKLPFQEAGSLVLTRRWRDKGGKIETDLNGNDIRPSQEEITKEERDWLTYTAEDSSGFHTRALLFPIEAENTLTLYASRESVHIRSITLRPATELPTYAQYKAQHAGAKGRHRFSAADTGRAAGVEERRHHCGGLRPGIARHHPLQGGENQPEQHRRQHLVQPRQGNRLGVHPHPDGTV